MITNWGGPTLFHSIAEPLYYPIAYPINWITYTAGIYLTVLLTLERFYAVCILKKRPKLHHTKIAIACVYIYAIIYNIPHFFEKEWKSQGMDYVNMDFLKISFRYTNQQLTTAYIDNFKYYYVSI